MGIASPTPTPGVSISIIPPLPRLKWTGGCLFPLKLGPPNLKVLT